MRTYDSNRQAYTFILFLGLVSLFGDITYEGARSVAGPYLALLGAGSFAIGLIGGIGECLGYGLRLVSGFVADSTKAYWAMVIVGYGLLFGIPLIAIADTWWLAGIFLILERAGKGIRAPARDAILSHATQKIGRGFGFGLHEAIDQVGAIIGPLIFSVTAFTKGNYRDGFLILFIPVVLCMTFLLLAKSKISTPELLEITKDEPQKKYTDKLDFSFWVYAVFCFLTVAGLINFHIISFHFKIKGVITDVHIPLIYAVAMGIDALAGLLFGKLYDKKSFNSLKSIPIISLPICFLALTSNPYLAILSMILWGAVMGIHETIMRAAIADVTPKNKRGSAYGIFNTIYGIAFFTGSSITGWLYEKSILWTIIFNTFLQILSLFVILRWRREV